MLVGPLHTCGAALSPSPTLCRSSLHCLVLCLFLACRSLPAVCLLASARSALHGLRCISDRPRSLAAPPFYSPHPTDRLTQNKSTARYYYFLITISIIYLLAEHICPLSTSTPPCEYQELKNQRTWSGPHGFVPQGSRLLVPILLLLP